MQEERMLSLDYIRLLWDYNYWAQHKLLDCLETVSAEDFVCHIPYSMGSLHEQVVHTMWAEAVWLSRSKFGITFTYYKTEDYPNIASIRQQWASIESDWRAFLAGLSEADLEKRIEVTATDGTKFIDVLAQMLIHVVNHGTDHRSQMLRIIHDFGGETYEQGLSFYYREKDALK
jgi:uncharacterized damage-inducible protein DinB